MSENPYQAEAVLEPTPNVKKPGPLFWAAFLVSVLLSGGGAGLVAGRAIANSDWVLGLGLVMLLVGLGTSQVTAQRVRARNDRQK